MTVRSKRSQGYQFSYPHLIEHFLYPRSLAQVSLDSYQSREVGAQSGRSPGGGTESDMEHRGRVAVLPLRCYLDGPYSYMHSLTYTGFVDLFFFPLFRTLSDLREVASYVHLLHLHLHRLSCCGRGCGCRCGRRDASQDRGF